MGGGGEERGVRSRGGIMEGGGWVVWWVEGRVWVRRWGLLVGRIREWWEYVREGKRDGMSRGC